MKTEDRKKLGADMLDVANEIVGNVGPDIKVNVCADVFEYTPNVPIAQFCLHRVDVDYSEVMDTWTKWIESYCSFRKLDRSELSTLIDDPTLMVSWLHKPTVDPEGLSEEYIKSDHGNGFWDEWVDGKKPDIENPRFVRVRAYLMVYRSDDKAISK